MRYQEGINILDAEDCEIADYAMKHFIIWCDTIEATTKDAVVYGIPVKELIAKARNLKRSFHARTKAGKKELEEKEKDNDE